MKTYKETTVKRTILEMTEQERLMRIALQIQWIFDDAEKAAEFSVPAWLLHRLARMQELAGEAR